MENITELNKLIYSGAKLGWEIQLETLTRNL